MGSAPEFQEFASGNDEPRRLLRLNVYFDNPVPRDGSYEDRGGYWAPVELWHREAAHWSTLYQKGMRVLVEGRTVRDEWEDSEDNARVTFKIEARRVGILPHRVQSVAMRERSSEQTAPGKHIEQITEPASSSASKPKKRRGASIRIDGHQA
ncbi:single-stranded DNA-binding protein [Pseudomonas viridiflava]|nr:single-stranded DNA-binding protein [Pseudomonas viridiflava]